MIIFCFVLCVICLICDIGLLIRAITHRLVGLSFLALVVVAWAMFSVLYVGSLL